ncbi:MAG: isoleucine--tRNA ligase [Vicingaceae bacterium]
MNKYPEYKGLDLSKIAAETLSFWEKDTVFDKSISTREGAEQYVFYEGPPSANGLPGIHHVMARTIKDIFCRFQTLKGFQVKRKAGWDTHGLPIELSVEKELGITKEDIGTKISIEDYNKKCREAVMRHTSEWAELTRIMGYWVDMDHPYVTYDSKYMESVWFLLKSLFEKDMLYKGYSIQPYSPKAGTGLSSHELNQPGTYKMVKDTTIVAQFEVAKSPETHILLENEHGKIYFLAWTTTPWTLPSNSALALGEKIEYVAVSTYNQYTFEPITVILAKAVIGSFFKSENERQDLSYETGQSNIPWKIAGTYTGHELLGIKYHQLLPYVRPIENIDNAFQTIPGDFVSTEEGTGIVHIAPTFGADDMRVAQAAGVPAILVEDSDGFHRPLVDLQGRFVEEMKEFGGEYVKEEYLADDEKTKDYKSIDVRIAIKLKEENKAFRVAKYEHTYPHCWRTDKPILYYPLDSWFVRTTAAKDRLIELNNTINWKPASTGSGRFGNWLENLQDWNLSRSRYWGIPLPIWSTEGRSEIKCIGSLEELKLESEKAVQAGLMKSNPLADFEIGNMNEANYRAFDMHRPFVDEIILVSKDGKPMKREKDLIDVWFDSGSMPYAQWHYPFENKDVFDQSFPADFIAEGVDQTRGWFFTLHAIATMCFDSVAYKNVVSNGLVLDKNGQKMSKRLGNATDPFKTIEKYGADAVRWYMISNAQPWENLKFDEDGITEVQRKFFGTLYNTYGFFALYANVDGFTYREKNIPVQERRELDRWIMSKLNSLVLTVEKNLSDYEPTKATRAIQDFVTDDLSNWYVRLSRRIFWKGEYSAEKIAAYQTLYDCLVVVCKLSSPVAPFYTDKLFKDLNAVSGKDPSISVHLTRFPAVQNEVIDLDLEEKMELAQRISSLVLGLRKKENIKVRQPLSKIMVPVFNSKFQRQIEQVSDLILSEVNVKAIEFIGEENNVLVKKIKPNFRSIGPKYGKLMKDISARLEALTQDQIADSEKHGDLSLIIDGQEVILTSEDFEIVSQDIPGWLVANDDKLTVAVDIRLSIELLQEGIAREFVNRIQNLRKDAGLDVTDRIDLKILQHEEINDAIKNNIQYICAETLADGLDLVDSMSGMSGGKEVEINDHIRTSIHLQKR